ncbi:MAG: MFS transporter, partial [Candidatus Krumholzibacteria bacterium]|nr:MFS transporter [Candidatus Krumholzibacteria bacterium]
EIYDNYRQRYGKEPRLLPPGRFLRVANSELYQSFNPLFVILFTPLIVTFFGFLVTRGRGISTARKVFYGLVLTTISLLIMAVAGLLSDNGSVKVGAYWLVGFYAIVTIGELCLSPMGLSLVTKLSPKRLVGLAMGGWFLATAFGNNFSGFFGGIQGRMTPVSFFLVLAAMAAASSLFIYLLLPKLDAAIKKYGA